MRAFLLALTTLAVASLFSAAPAPAQFKSYFDVSKLVVPGLTEPAWGRRVDEDRLLYLCIDSATCPSPTGVTIKGVVRAEPLEEAFASGELSPGNLTSVGRANAERTGSVFMEAKAVTVAGAGGVHMEAEANKVYFVTKFIGRGNNMLDIKVTSPDLKLARKLSDEAAAALVAQAFP